MTRPRHVFLLNHIHAYPVYHAKAKNHDIASLGTRRPDGSVVSIHDLVLTRLRPSVRTWFALHAPSTRFSWRGPQRYPAYDDGPPFIEAIVYDDHEAFAVHMRWRGVTEPEPEPEENE